MSNASWDTFITMKGFTNLIVVKFTVYKSIISSLNANNQNVKLHVLN